MQGKDAATIIQNRFFTFPDAALVFLRCRQFVEMVNGTDSEVCCLTIRSPKSQDSYPGSPSLSPRHGASNTHLHTGGTHTLTHAEVLPSLKSKTLTRMGMPENIQPKECFPHSL